MEEKLGKEIINLRKDDKQKNSMNKKQTDQHLQRLALARRCVVEASKWHARGHRDISLAAFS